MSEQQKDELLAVSERIRGEMELAVYELGPGAALHVASTALMTAAKSIHAIEPQTARKIIDSIVAEAGR